MTGGSSSPAGCGGLRRPRGAGASCPSGGAAVASAASTSYGSGSVSEPCRRRDGRRSRTGGPASSSVAGSSATVVSSGSASAGGRRSSRSRASRIRCGIRFTGVLVTTSRPKNRTSTSSSTASAVPTPRCSGPATQAPSRPPAPVPAGPVGRPAVGEVEQAGRGERERGPSDADPAALLRLGQLAQQVHARGQEEDRQHHRERAEAAPEQVVHDPADRAAAGRPERDPGDDRDRDHGQAEPVAAVGRVEPGGRRLPADRTGGTAGPAGEQQPAAGQRPAERRQRAAGAAPPPGPSPAPTGRPTWSRRRALRSGQSRARA